MTHTASVNRTESANGEAAILRKSDWKWEPVEGTTVPKLIESVPATWCLRPDGMSKVILAIFSCPNCHGVRALIDGIHTINPFGLVQPDLDCGGDTTRHCSYHRKTYLDRWNRKPLYACALETWDRGHQRWTPEMVYTHATTQEEATRQLGPTTSGKLYRIVAIAPALGFFVTDGKDDTKLSADAPTQKGRI